MVTQPVRRKKSEAGQAAVLVTLAISTFLLAAVGLAIDGSQLYAQRQMAQTAADAAATAGIMTIFNGSSAIGTSTYYCTSSNSTSPCTYASKNEFTTTYASGSCTASTGSDCIKVNPSPGVTVSYLASQTPNELQVTITRAVNMTLTKMLPGISSFNVTASATAAIVSLGLTNCVTTLDSSGTGLNVTGNASISMPTCGIAIDSSSSSALDVTGNIGIQASSINVVGGVSKSGNITINPTPVTNAAVASDPLANVPEPTYSSTCTYTNLSYTGNQTVTLSPGTYCGGITLGGNVNVTFDSGTYILLGGGLTASGNITLTSTGNGVTFYNTYNSTYPFDPISITGNVTMNLTATNSGPLEGMLFFQDRTAPSGYTESFVGNASSTLTGALYFPTSTVSYTGNSSSSIENIAIIAYNVSLVGNASLESDPTAAGAAVQLAVALVQ